MISTTVSSQTDVCAGLDEVRRIVVFTVFRDDSRFHEHRRICFCVGTNHSPVAYSHVYTGMHTDTLSQEWIDPRSDIDQSQSIDQLEGRLRVSTAIPQKVRSNLTLLNRSRHPRIKDRKPRKNNKKKLDPSAQALAWARQVVVSGSFVGLGSGQQPKKNPTELFRHGPGVGCWRCCLRSQRERTSGFE